MSRIRPGKNRFVSKKSGQIEQSRLWCLYLDRICQRAGQLLRKKLETISRKIRNQRKCSPRRRSRRSDGQKHT